MANWYSLERAKYLQQHLDKAIEAAEWVDADDIQIEVGDGWASVRAEWSGEDHDS